MCSSASDASATIYRDCHLACSHCRRVQIRPTATSNTVAILAVDGLVAGNGGTNCGSVVCPIKDQGILHRHVLAQERLDMGARLLRLRHKLSEATDLASSIPLVMSASLCACCMQGNLNPGLAKATEIGRRLTRAAPGVVHTYYLGER